MAETVHCTLRYGIEIRECKVVNGIEGETVVKVEHSAASEVLSSVGLNLEERGGHRPCAVYFAGRTMFFVINVNASRCLRAC